MVKSPWLLKLHFYYLFINISFDWKVFNFKWDLPETYISLERPMGFEKGSQNEGRVGYLPLESNIKTSSNTAYLKTKVDIFSLQLSTANFFLHPWKVMVEKCMRIEMLFFCDLIQIFFLLCLFLPLPFLLPFLAHFVCWGIWAALDWCWRDCVTKEQR